MKKVDAAVQVEPELLFGGRNPELDPRTGLERFGPYFSSSEKAPSPTRVRVGIVATGANATLAKRVIQSLGMPIPSTSSNKWVNPDFPGFTQGSSIGCDFVTSDQWNAGIAEEEVRELEAIADVNERIAACANLYAKKIAKIKSEEDKPNVVVCVLSKWVEDYCGRSKFTRGASRPRLTEAEKLRGLNHSLADFGIIKSVDAERDFDLRNALKGKTMKHGIPIQVLRESSAAAFLKKLDEGKAQPGDKGPDDFGWNFSTALYYKANGRPWRIAQLTPGTCYVGISFFRNLRSPTRDLQFSMAQVFTHSLEGFVIRGTEVTVDEHTREPFMSERQAFDLMSHVLGKYEEKADRKPDRVVVHKTSRFSSEERAGIVRAIGKTPKDLVALGSVNARFLRKGMYPPLRGTRITLSDHEHLLYTTGYTPRLRTYPGARVPDPVLVAHHGDGEVDLVCREILGLTKLDWNSTTFASRLPITIGFAQSVGAVLSELTEDKDIKDEYRFYM